MISLLLTSFLAAVASFFLTLLLRKYALNANLLDIPNQRSSHVTPIPRGGGMAIVLVFMIGLIIFLAYKQLDVEVLFSFIGAGTLVALVGFLDDHRHVSPIWRLLAHFSAAIWALAWLGSLPSADIFGKVFYPGWAGFVIAAIGIVWLLNLFNFMDGIDGIAVSEGIFVSGCGVVFATMAGNIELVYVALLFIGAVIGFLCWNWPPAKIFMGDVGSGFLGITLGVFAYWSIIEGVTHLWTWVIVFGVFLVDASFTLVRRFFQGLPWYQAHCSHAYQHAAKRWGHLKVTLGVSIINVFWLLPNAYFSNKYPSIAPYLVLIALFPLVVLVFLLGAGRQERDSQYIEQ